MSFKTCMGFFLILNTKEDILKNQTVVGPHDFHSRERNTIEVNGDHQLFDYQHSLKYLLYVQHKKQTHTGFERHEDE